MFSQGKSQILRLAAPIQLLLNFIETFEEARDNTDKQNENETDMRKEAANECEDVITLGPPTDKDSGEEN